MDIPFQSRQFCITQFGNEYYNQTIKTSRWFCDFSFLITTSWLRVLSFYCDGVDRKPPRDGWCTLHGLQEFPGCRSHEQPGVQPGDMGPRSHRSPEQEQEVPRSWGPGPEPPPCPCGFYFETHWKQPEHNNNNNKLNDSWSFSGLLSHHGQSATPSFRAPGKLQTSVYPLVSSLLFTILHRKSLKSR